MTGPTDDEFGRHHFLAWSRQGIATTLNNPDYGGSLPDRPTVTVDLNVTAQNPGSVTAVPTVTVHTFGPGDVLGIDPRQVVRTEPKDSTTNFEPNYLVGIEFDTPDFPWLFTPAAPAGDRIRPWITLIVLKGSEFTPVAGVVNPLPAIDVTSIAALQSLDDTWNWAHTQVSGDAGLAATAASDPSNVISRLLCPRRLDPETAYTAFVVPTFEIGRQTGLGLDVSALHTSDPAWTSSTGTPLRLPVFYQWQFHTSDQGDFESLVRQLVPRKFGANIGERPMTVDDPMPDVPSAGDPLMLQGALQSIVATTTEWDDPAKTAFQTAVAGLVNRVVPLVDDPNGPDPQVVPPMYGRYPAGVDALTVNGARWIDELGLDPRNRTIGGMGAQVVDANQTSLLASAWQQVAGIEAANALLRQAQLARATTTMLHAQLSTALTSTILTLTTPLHAKLLASPRTIRAAIDASRVPLRLTSPTARRLTHPTSLIRRRQVALTGVRVTPGSLFTAINSGRIAVVPPVTLPGGLVPIEQVGTGTGTGAGGGTASGSGSGSSGSGTGSGSGSTGGSGSGSGSGDGFPWSRWFPLTLDIDTPAGDFTFTIGASPQRSESGSGSGSGMGAGSGSGSGSTVSSVNPVALTLDAINAVSAQPDFVITAPQTAVAPGGTSSGSGGGSGAGGIDSPDAARFRLALGALAQAWAGVATAPPLAEALDFTTLRNTLTQRLDPVLTIPARMSSIVQVAAGLNWHPPDPIREIMAAPSFPQPMYVPLRDLSLQYIMPGADQIPNESVGLVLTNPAFVEAYMVGLSHEMTRQLLFVGYPTDCMGTYFRQFWDVSGYVPQPSDPTDPTALADRLYDIPPIITWALPDPLGDHPNHAGVNAPLVLIVRGELLRRYPDAIIYAAPAKLVGDARTIDDSAPEQHPIFHGALAPDMNFFGFNISVDDAKGDGAIPEGYFFVFQQHPSGPRFGLEPSANGTVSQWSDLAWTNFGSTPSDQAPAALAAPATGAPTARPDVLPPPTLLPPFTELFLASSTMRRVLAQRPIPNFLSAGDGPTGVSISGADAGFHWGADAAQTAYITARLPFRVAIHADLMIPDMDAPS
jgi:hypothetical protein